jgi:hypothetical protein
MRRRSMTTPDDDGPSRERRFSDTERRQRDSSDTGSATTPGLVVTEGRLADGRAITYFGIDR